MFDSTPLANKLDPLTIHIKRNSHSPIPKFISRCTGVDSGHIRCFQDQSADSLQEWTKRIYVRKQ